MLHNLVRIVDEAFRKKPTLAYALKDYGAMRKITILKIPSNYTCLTMRKK